MNLYNHSWLINLACKLTNQQTCLQTSLVMLDVDGHQAEPSSPSTQNGATFTPGGLEAKERGSIN